MRLKYRSGVRLKYRSLEDKGRVQEGGLLEVALQVASVVNGNRKTGMLSFTTQLGKGGRLRPYCWDEKVLFSSKERFKWNTGVLPDRLNHLGQLQVNSRDVVDRVLGGEPFE